MLNSLTPATGGGLRLYGLSWSKGADDLPTGKALPPVLVVDDEDHVRTITARMLSEDGYDVVSAESGEKALAILRKNPEIRVALIDLMMPGMSGTVVAERIREVAPACNVIFMTGYSSEQAGLATSFPEHPLLTKPFTSTQLIRQVRHSLHRESH